MRRAALAATLAWLAAAHARADDMHRSPSHERGEVLLGLKGALGIEWLDRAGDEPDALRLTGGGGVFGEGTLIAGWMELEVGAVVTRAGDELVLTIEPLLKKPLHVDPHVDLYVALGPVAGVAIDGEERVFGLVGGAVAFGVYVWLADELGLDVDLTLQLAWVREPAIEITLGVGPVLRL